MEGRVGHLPRASAVGRPEDTRPRTASGADPHVRRSLNEETRATRREGRLAGKHRRRGIGRNLSPRLTAVVGGEDEQLAVDRVALGDSVAIVQNAIASRKTPACAVVNWRTQLAPSVVRKICACPCSAGPALMTHARRSLRGAMARKSSPDAPGTESTDHVAPPLLVRATRPRVPLAQTTDELVATSPRNSAVVPLC
jgi:hypothetical protein